MDVRCRSPRKRRFSPSSANVVIVLAGRARLTLATIQQWHWQASRRTLDNGDVGFVDLIASIASL
jgi:hypothetical protein